MMTSVVILLLLGICLTAADSRHSGPLPHNNGFTGAQADLMEQLKQEMLEQIQVQADKYDKQIKEQAEKYDHQIREIKIHDKAMENVISEIKRENEARKGENEALLSDNTKLRELLDGHNKRLMILEGDLATPYNSNKDIRKIPAGDSQMFTNISGYNPETSSGVVAFQARNLGFTGANGAQIPFELVDVNIGDAYDPSGLFTAPVAGIYQFSYEVLADNSCGTDHTSVDLTVNGVDIMRSCSEYVASGGSSMILQLVAGDTFSLTIEGGCTSIQDSSLAHNQFGGHLLYEIL